MTVNLSQNRQVPLELNQTESTCLFGWFFCAWGYHHVVPSCFCDILQSSMQMTLWDCPRESHHGMYFHFLGFCIFVWQPSLLVSVCLLSSYSTCKLLCSNTQWGSGACFAHKDYKNSNTIFYIVLHCTWCAIIYMSLHGTAYLRRLLHKEELHWCNISWGVCYIMGSENVSCSTNVYNLN
jgi:hypothetical protein